MWYVESGGPPSARVVVTLTKTPGTGDMLDYLVETPIVRRQIVVLVVGVVVVAE